MIVGMPNAGAKVRDVMTEPLMFLHAGQSQDDASAILRARGVSGAPVLGDGGKLVGVVSMSDLADPRRRSPLTAGLVSDAMTRVVYAVRATDPVMAVIHLLMDEQIHRAIVVNDDGSLAGIVVPTDILRAIARGIDVRGAASSEEPVSFVDLRARS
jgi:CBS domain-containing protein